MDPNATYQSIVDAVAVDDTEAAADGRENLSGWIARGGFLPAELDAMADTVYESLQSSAADIAEADDGIGLEFRIFIRPAGCVDLSIGDPAYDSDHSGHCGAGSVAIGDTVADCRKAVAAAFDDAIESFFCQ